MKRSNNFDVKPRTSTEKEVLKRVLDASASLWNEVNYQRRQEFFKEDGDVWNVDTGELEGRYKHVVGSCTAQQIIRKNTRTWKAYFKNPDGEKNLPGYWGNEEDGRKLHTLIRSDRYEVNWKSTTSTIEIPIGEQLKNEYGYGYHDKLELEIHGNPKWSGEQGQLDIKYDEVDDCFRAYQSVTVPEVRCKEPLAEKSVALDLGANNIVALTTSDGKQYLFQGRTEFQNFRETTHEIARLQSKLPEDIHTSKRIQKLYRKRTERRNHMMDTLIKELVEILYSEGVSTIYVGDLDGVLNEPHWSAECNEKTHSFWAFGRFKNRLSDKAEEYGIEVIEAGEEYTSKECPDCRDRESTVRVGDTFSCEKCGFEGHSDLKASRMFLERELDIEVGAMARPVLSEWDSHRWLEIPYSQESPKGLSTDRQLPKRVSA